MDRRASVVKRLNRWSVVVLIAGMAVLGDAITAKTSSWAVRFALIAVAALLVGGSGALFALGRRLRTHDR